MKKIYTLVLLLAIAFGASAQGKKFERRMLERADRVPMSKTVTEDSDYNYDWEPTTQSQLEWEYNFINTVYFEDGYGDGTGDVYDIYMEGPEFLANIYVITPLNSPELLPLGTYPFSFEYTHNTALSSFGGNDEEDLPSYAGTGFDDEGYYDTSYYFESGNVVVSMDGTDTVLNIVLTTHYGSQITIFPEGAIPPTSVNKVEDDDFKVYSQNGMLVVEGAEDGATVEVYNVQGQLLNSTVATERTEVMNLPKKELLIVRSGKMSEKVIL